MRTVKEATDWYKSIVRGYGGMCLQFTRSGYKIPAKYGDARTAWRNAKFRHLSLKNAPVGAFVFLDHKNSKYGHVAPYMGNGTIRTTNSATNKVTTDTISKWEDWGYKVLGWSEDLNGYRVPGLKPKTVSSRAILPGDSGTRVKKLQKELNRVFSAYSKLVVDGKFGPKTTKVVKEFQRRTKLKQDGQVGPATQAKLKTLGVVL